MIRFYDQDVKSGLKDKKKLASFLGKLVEAHRPEVQQIQLDFIFCTDSYLLTINARFLSHHTYTDIITFDLSEKPEKLMAEVYISTERLAENALKYRTTYREELHRVVFHGVLHLCGFKDKIPVDKVVMKQQEDACLLRYFADSQG